MIQQILIALLGKELYALIVPNLIIFTFIFFGVQLIFSAIRVFKNIMEKKDG